MIWSTHHSNAHEQPKMNHDDDENQNHDQRKDTKKHHEHEWIRPW